MASITVKVTGLKQAHRAFRERPAAAVRVTSRRLNLGAEQIIALAKADYVPVMFGTLRASGHVIPSKVTAAGMGSVVISPAQAAFGGPSAPYALVVHENQRAGKTGGFSPQGKKYKHWSRVGQWKYLETPAKLLAPRILADLRTDLNRVMLSA